MCHPIGDDRISGARVHLDRHEIAHRATGKPECGFFAEQFGDSLLESVDGRIFTSLLIADFGVGDCLPHPGGRLALRVTDQRNDTGRDHRVLIRS
jgi:hypothetical protein